MVKDKIQNTYLLQPEYPLKSTWDTFMSILILYSLFVIPTRIAFQIQSNSISNQFDYFVDCCFGLDMLFTFITIYEDENDQIITNQKKIIYNYLSSWFIPDFISTFPFDLIISSVNTSLLRSIKLIRMFRLVKLMKLMRVIRMKRKIQVNPFEAEHPVIFALFTLCCKICFIAHFSACIFYAMSPCSLHDRENNYNNNYDLWLQCGGNTWYSRYLLSLYWTLLTMLGIGYGDVTLHTNNGRLFSIIVMACGSIVFGFMVASIAECVHNLDPKETEKRKKMDSIRTYLYDKKFKRSFLNTLWAHFEYYYSKLPHEDSLSLTDGMPLMMQKQIIQSSKDTISQQVFFESFSYQIMIQMMCVLQPMIVYPGEVIIKQNDYCSDMFFILQGRVIGMRQLSTTLLSLPSSPLKSPLKSPPLSPQSTSKLTNNNNSNNNNNNILVTIINQKYHFGIQYLISNLLSNVTHNNNNNNNNESDNNLIDDSSFAKVTYMAHVVTDVMWLSSENLLPILEKSNITKEIFLKSGLEEISLLNQIIDPLERNDEIGYEVQKKIEKIHDYYTSPLIIQDGKIISNENIDSILQSHHTFDQSSKTIKVYKTVTLITPKSNIQSLFQSKSKSKFMKRQESFSKHSSLTGSSYQFLQETTEEMWKRQIINPHCTNKLIFDGYISFLCIVCLVVLPYRIGFELKTNLGWNIFDLIMDISFSIDFITNFFTAYELPDFSLQTTHQLIFKHYIKTWFIFDFLSTIPFYRLSNSHQLSLQSLKLIRLFRLFKIFRSFRVFKAFSLASRQTSKSITADIVEFQSSTSRVIILFIILGFITHILGCIWIWSAMNTSDFTWVEAIGIKSGDDKSKYIAAIYYAFTTMSTVGYGDIHAVTDHERFWAIVLMLIGANFLAYIIGAVCSHVFNRAGSMSLIDTRLGLIRDYLSAQGTSQSIRRNVTQHTCYVLEICSPFPELQIWKSLPHHLRSKTINFILQPTIQTIPLFYSMNSIPTILSVLYTMVNPCRTLPNTCIYNYRTTSGGIYFIIKGVVRIKSLNWFSLKLDQETHGSKNKSLNSLNSNRISNNNSNNVNNVNNNVNIDIEDIEDIDSETKYLNGHSNDHHENNNNNNNNNNSDDNDNDSDIVDNDNNEVIFQSGMFFGFENLLNYHNDIWSVWSISETSMLMITDDHLQELKQIHPIIYEKLINDINSYIDEPIIYKENYIEDPLNANVVVESPYITKLKEYKIGKWLYDIGTWIWSDELDDGDEDEEEIMTTLDERSKKEINKIKENIKNDPIKPAASAIYFTISKNVQLFERNEISDINEINSNDKLNQNNMNENLIQDQQQQHHQQSGLKKIFELFIWNSNKTNQLQDCNYLTLSEDRGHMSPRYYNTNDNINNLNDNITTNVENDNDDNININNNNDNDNDKMNQINMINITTCHNPLSSNIY